jgi:hypothetical protein
LDHDLYSSFSATKGANFEANRLTVSSRPLKSQGDEIIAIGALDLDRIALPPGEAPAKLKGSEAGKNVMIEKSA